MNESTAFEAALDDIPSDDDFKLTMPQLPDESIPDPLGADKERRKEVFAQMAHLCIRGMQEPSDIYVALLKETAGRL